MHSNLESQMKLFGYVQSATAHTFIGALGYALRQVVPLWRWKADRQGAELETGGRRLAAGQVLRQAGGGAECGRPNEVGVLRPVHLVM